MLLAGLIWLGSCLGSELRSWLILGLCSFYLLAGLLVELLAEPLARLLEDSGLG